MGRRSKSKTRKKKIKDKEGKAKIVGRNKMRGKRVEEEAVDEPWLNYDKRKKHRRNYEIRRKIAHS